MNGVMRRRIVVEQKERESGSLSWGSGIRSEQGRGGWQDSRDWEFVQIGLDENSLGTILSLIDRLLLIIDDDVARVTRCEASIRLNINNRS